MQANIHFPRSLTARALSLKISCFVRLLLALDLSMSQALPLRSIHFKTNWDTYQQGDALNGWPLKILALSSSSDCAWIPLYSLWYVIARERGFRGKQRENLINPSLQPTLTTMRPITDGTKRGKAFALQKLDGNWTPTSSVYYPSYSAPVQSISSSPIYVLWMLFYTKTGENII